MKHYRIIRNDRTGMYFVQEKRSFLFVRWWKTWINNYYSHSEPIEFETLEWAEASIHEHIRINQQSTRTVVKEITAP